MIKREDLYTYIYIYFIVKIQIKLREKNIMIGVEKKEKIYGDETGQC